MSSLEDDNSVAGITKALSALPLSRKIYSSYTQSDTDTAGSDNCCQPSTVINSSSKTGSSISHRIRQKRRPIGGYHSDNSPAKGAILPPIGVFWDIENCQVPRGRSAVCIAQLIRDLFFDGFREAEFIVVCDVKKETNQVVQELCDAQVNLIHVSSTSKNAADEKLRQCMRRFADTHGAPSAIILISGDVNFAADLSDLRHRKKIHVILLHKQNVSKALILCASEHHCFTELTDNVPARPSTNKNAAASPCSSGLVVTNLPIGHEATRVKARLRQLSDNCGGRVARLDVANGMAVMRFTNDDQALRAQKRMDGEDVFGNKICATHFSPLMRFGCDAARWDSPNKIARKYRQELLDMDEGYQTMASTASWAPMPPMPQFANRANAAQSANWNLNTDVSHTHMCLNPAMQQVYSAMPMYSACGQSMSPTAMLPGCSQASWLNEKMYIEKDDTCRSSFSQVTSEALNGKNIRGPTVDAAVDYGAPSGSAFSRAASQPWTIPKHSTVNRAEISSVNRPSSSSPWQQNVQSHASVNSSGNSSDTENYFKPIQKSENGPVELHVSNLDQTIDQPTMQKMLLAMFKEFVNVLHLQIHMLNDGSMTASVKVPSKQDAQYAISQMHRRRIGFKRILISYASGNETANLQMLKSHVMALLQSIPGHSLPLFKFRELFEARYLVSVSLSDMYKMRDICTIKEDAKGRLVSLNPEHRDTPSPQLAGQENEQPFCVLHCKIGLDKCWAVQTATALPNVFIGIRELSESLNKLLKSHSGNVPLPSLAVCYEADLGLSLTINDKTGVPLEHLVSCCPGVTIRQGVSGVKHLIWAVNKPNTSSNESQGEDATGQSPKCVSPALAHQLQQFSREIVDLLRTTAKCQLLFNKFIPAYHHHFGRQCRVADYGYTKLIDLMEALSNTVQVMGGGNRRTVTLTHRAQVKRFTSDLCRVLKTQNNKQMTLADLPAQFEKVLDRPWDITEYGVCVISDILDEVNENTIVKARLPSGDVMIGTPKHVQTAEEVRKTNVFKVEVIQLLKHAPQYSMQFNKFVPAYHHHFGHQCRVSDYGFTKLIELFEAIPEIVKVNEGSDTERFVSLVPAEALKVLQEQLEQILSVSARPVSLAQVCNEFIQLYGYALKPELYESEDIIDLLDEFKHVKVTQSAEGIFLSLEDRAAVHRLGIRAWSVLLNNNKMKVFNFLEKYNKVYLEICDIEKLREAKDIVTVPNPSTMESVISLTPLWRFAAKALLCCERGHTPLTVFESSFYNLCRKQIDPTEYGFQNLTSLIAAIPEVLMLKERNNRKKYICVNSDLLKSGVCLPPSLPIYNNESSSSISSDAQISNTKKRATNHHASDNKRKTANSKNPSAGRAALNEPKLADYFTAAIGRNADNSSSYLDHKVSSSTSSSYNDYVKTSDDLSARNWPPLKPNSVNAEPVGSTMNGAEIHSSETKGVRRNVASSSTANGDKKKRPREMPPGVSPLYDFFYEMDLIHTPPKPDSPSTNQDSMWTSTLWEPPSHSTTEFVVNLPPSSTDAQIDMDLISPTLSLMSACPNPFAVFNSPSVMEKIRNKHQQEHEDRHSNVTVLPGLSGDQLVQAPPPSELPKPSLSLVAPKKDESQQVEDIRSNVSTTPLTNSQTKRKGRIAAVFPSSMEPN